MPAITINNDIGNKKRRTDESRPALLEERKGSSTLSFHSSFPGGDVKLFEITPELAAMIEAGESLKIVGNESGSDTVLCTNASTYTIKKVETSNSVFLVPPSTSENFEINFKCSNFYEITASSGKVDNIKNILTATQFISLDAEKFVKTEKLVSRDDLDSLIQASNLEIDNELCRLKVIEIDGKLRLVSKAAIYETTRAILDEAIEQSWSLDNIIADECISSMSSIHHPTVILQALSLIGEEVKTGIWKLDSTKVVVVSAHILFNSKPVTYQWPVDDFLLQWSASIPGSATAVDEHLLNGIAKKRLLGTSSYYLYESL